MLSAVSECISLVSYLGAGRLDGGGLNSYDSVWLNVDMYGTYSLLGLCGLKCMRVSYLFIYLAVLLFNGA